jgi:hypothetical protein
VPHSTEGEEWKCEYMRANDRSWKAHQGECEDIGESVMETEIINWKSGFNEDHRYFEQTHNNKQIGSESSAKWLWT